MRRLSTLLALLLGLAVATPEVHAGESRVAAAKKKKTKKKKKKPAVKKPAGAFPVDSQVVVHAAGHALDKPDGEKVFQVMRTQKLTVVRCDGSWVHIRDGRGREGWLPALSLRAAPKKDGGGGDKSGWSSSG